MKFTDPIVNKSLTNEFQLIINSGINFWSDLLKDY